MFDTMIILAPADICDSIIAEFAVHNPTLDYRVIPSLGALLALPSDVLAGARLISFTNPIIVPRQTLDALGHGAYNFHPGPPHYPGLAPAQFAIYQGSQIFGATVHRMVEKVDAGPIVAAEFCLVAPDAAVLDLESRAAGLLVGMFRALARALACEPAPLPVLPVTWSPVKSTRQAFAALCEIPLDLGRAEMERRIRAFSCNNFGLEPTVTLHGYRFRYAGEAPTSVPAASVDPLDDVVFVPTPAPDATRASAAAAP